MRNEEEVRRRLKEMHLSGGGWTPFDIAIDNANRAGAESALEWVLEVVDDDEKGKV